MGKRGAVVIHVSVAVSGAELPEALAGHSPQLSVPWP